MKIVIIGAGLGSEKYLTEVSREKIDKADLILTTKRIFEKLGHLNKNMICQEIGEISKFIIENKDKYKNSNVVILATGDIGFFSISKLLKRDLEEFELEFINGISSLQYLTSALKTTYSDIKVISIHGRENKVIPFVSYNPRVFVLTGGEYKAGDVIKDLYRVGLKNITITVGENLSDENERIVTDTIENMLEMEFGNLSVMLIENRDYIDCHKKIFDADFIRGKVPMTKSSIRTLAISMMEVKPTDKILDVGAGTGAVTIELARRAYEGMVYGIEQNDVALELIKENREKLKAYNIEIIKGLAPDGFEKLPKIDKAFIGGSKGNLNKIIEKLVENNKKIKIVITSIALETLNEAMICLEKLGFMTSISCINVSNVEKIAGYSMMKSENPIYIITGELNSGETNENN